MLGRIARKSTRHVLNLELLEDRRLLSASLLGAVAPVLAHAQPPLAAVEHVAAQTSAAVVTATSSAVAALPLPAVAHKLEVAAKLASPLPAVLPDVSLDTQVNLSTSSTAPEGVQVEVTTTAAPAVIATPTRPTPITVGVSVAATTGTSAAPVVGPVNVSAQGGVAVSGPAPATPLTAAVSLPSVTSGSAATVVITTPPSHDGVNSEVAAAVTPSPAVAPPAAAFSPSPQLLDTLFRDAAALNAITANVAAAAALPNTLIPQLLAAVPTIRALPTSGSAEAAAVTSPERGLPTPALRVENLPALDDVVRAENVAEAEGSPQLLDHLAEANLSAVVGLEQAALQLVGQLRALQQQFGDLLAGMGLYHWLLGAALGAAALSLHVRQRRRQATAAGDADPLLLGSPEFAFLGQANS